MRTLADVTWEEFLKYLLVERKVKNTQKNIGAYFSRFKAFLYAFKDKEFSRANFNDFVSDHLQKGSKPSHVNKFITLAKHLDTILGANQMNGYTRFKEEQEDRLVLSPAEIKRMLEVKINYKRYTRELQKRDFTAIHFLFQTGCRCDELQRLEWKDVRTAPAPHVIFRNTKGRKNLTAYITQWMYDLLQEMPRNGLRVFDSRNGNMFGAQEFNKTLKSIAYQAGLPEEVWSRVSFHTFRHSRASYLATFIDPFLLGSILGHADVKVTMRYYHPNFKQLLNAAYNNPLQSAITPTENLMGVAKEQLERIFDTNQFSVNVTGIGNKDFTIEIKALRKAD